MKKIKVKRDSKFSKIYNIIWIILFLLAGFTLLVDPVTYGDFFIGTITSAHQPQNGHGAKTRFIVKLDDDGHNVQIAQTPAAEPFVKGKRIIVQKCSTMILKRKSYRFIKDIDKQSELSEEEQLNLLINKGVRSTAPVQSGS